MHCSRPASRRGWVAAAVLALAASFPARAADVAVVGVPHLRSLSPAPGSAQLDGAVTRLGRFAPTLVCVEAMPGERVADFLRSPGRHGELLRTFALDAVRLAGEQQARLALAGQDALDQARALERQPDALGDDARLRLIALQLAGHEPWSAALNWTQLSDRARAAADEVLGAIAPARLQALATSDNEIASLAIPLARQRAHRRLCMVDPFADELEVAPLGPALMPLIDTPAVREGLDRFQRAQAAHWRAEDPAGLVGLLGWTNSKAFADADLAAQWLLFATPGTAHDAGKRRLALWHARNAQIGAHLFRAIASPEGGRTLLIIGASHRPFIESLLASQPWTTLHPATRLFER